MGRGLAMPHRRIRAADSRERLALDLFDDLWLRYRSRVSYVRTYEEVVRKAGASFVNDHIAFRTLASQEAGTGLHTVGRVFEGLGYDAASCYRFPDKKLRSVHYRHPNPDFPKIFISEFQIWEASPRARAIIRTALRGQRAPFGDGVLADLTRAASLPAARRAALLKTLLAFFARLPWAPPRRSDALALEDESQFAAWVLLHGYDVNHFTASVGSHGVAALESIDRTVAALRAAGVPMRAEVEGAPGSRLRQSATEAVVIPVRMRAGARFVRAPWTYAYFELAERGWVADPETGAKRRFEGFLGGQATHLFEMTRRAIALRRTKGPRGSRRGCRRCAE